jgi:hypothetical protein
MVGSGHHDFDAMLARHLLDCAGVGCDHDPAGARQAGALGDPYDHRDPADIGQWLVRQAR